MGTFLDLGRNQHKKLDENKMLDTRFMIAVSIMLLAASVSFGQSQEAGSAVDALLQPALSEPAVVLGNNDTAPTLLEAVITPANSLSPNPTSTTVGTIIQLENQVPNYRTVSPTISPQSTRPIYSPQRDGLPTLQQRRQLRAMPIEHRPNRPFHFYGNTVRRRIGR